MATQQPRSRWLAPAVLSFTGLLITGCGIVGSSVIRNARAVYNEAMVATNNEQVLNMIVRMRYQEPAGLLAVASITANVRVQTSVGAQFGIGPDSNFSGNLVPLSAGALYEENPTISYTPVHGEKYLTQLLSPLPLDFVVLLLSALGDSPATIELLIKEINGIRNPGFLTDPAAKPDPRFGEIAKLLASLHRHGSLTWSQQPGEKPTFVLFLRGSGEHYIKEVTRLHELLSLEKPRSLDEALTLRVLHAVGTPEGSVLELRPRSVYDLFQVAAAAVDVPGEHLESGLAPPLPPSGPAVAHIRIPRSKSPPNDAMVAIKHHGWWYSIAATDGRSKGT
ncbi:MAG: hypothetical protein ACYST0_04045, partial [Planctomycetota bacterium]